jgi:DNA-binding transcriptional LysR family regulator
MPNSTVSTKVSLLEKRLGVTLLQRTTRRLSLTDVGQTYFKRCLDALQAIHAAEDEATSAQQAPQGLLRITAPLEMGSAILPDVVRKYTKRHPGVQVELLMTDRVVDLVAEGVDLAIRAGQLEDSSLIARRLAFSSFGLVASPAYLKANGTPKQPKDLESHECLHFTLLEEARWTLSNGKSTACVAVKGRIQANDLTSLLAMAASGLGIAILPTFMGHDKLKRRELVRVLPEWASQPSPVHLVYPQQAFMPLKTQAFIDLALPALKESFGK